MIYTNEQLAYIKKHAKLPRDQLTDLFNQKFGQNRTISAIASTCKRYGWKADRSLQIKKTLYTKEEFAFIKKYSMLPRDELTSLFNEKFSQNKSKSAIVGVCKRNSWLADKSLWHFQKGSIPANKGTKGLSHANKTSFKKGDIPHNLRPIGSETFRDEYVWIKVAENHWVMKHLHVWTEANGPIPLNHVVTFVDGNRLNCSLENLLLITHREHCYINRNGFANYLGELKKTILGITRLQLKLHDLSKEN